MATKIIISGGGTGGHIFPAIAIANALKVLQPDCEILFVGAKGKMEMDKVPAAGYQIIGLNISGLQRGSILKNLALPFKIIGSVMESFRIIRRFKPDVVVGVGGYASAPLLFASSLKKVPYLIQEQNSYAGMTNKMLGKRASKICVAFDGMDKFFPSGKILKTGNPIRKNMVLIEGKRDKGIEFFKLNPSKKTILVIGGSLGAAVLNRSIEKKLAQIIEADVQLIWQTGKLYYQGIINRLGSEVHPNICVLEFLMDMDLAYAAADLVISRAGASTIAELCLIKKPVILVPSPNVAEDHQTKNANELVNNNAAILVRDVDAVNDLVDKALALLQDDKKCDTLRANIGLMALPNSDEVIAKEVLKLV